MPDSQSILGALETTFTSRRLPGRTMLGTAIFCALFASAEIITAVNKYNAPPSEVLDPSFRRDAILIAAILGTFFLVLTLLLAALYYAHIKHQVDVYENGLVIHSWRGSTVFPWDEISEMHAEPIYGNSRQPINWTVTLVSGDGQKEKFRGLDGILTLKNLIARKAKYLL